MPRPQTNQWQSWELEPAPLSSWWGSFYSPPPPTLSVSLGVEGTAFLIPNSPYCTGRHPRWLSSCPGRWCWWPGSAAWSGTPWWPWFSWWRWRPSSLEGWWGWGCWRRWHSGQSYRNRWQPGAGASRATGTHRSIDRGSREHHDYRPALAEVGGGGTELLIGVIVGGQQTQVGPCVIPCALYVA